MDTLFLGLPLWPVLAGIGAAVAALTAFGYSRRRPHTPPKSLDLSLDTPTEEPEGLVDVAELEALYSQRNAALRTRMDEIAGRLQALERRTHETLDLKRLLRAADKEERANLAAILKLEPRTSAATLAEAIGQAGSHVMGTLFRGGRGVVYEEVLQDVAAKLKLPKLSESVTAYDRERQILAKAFEKMLSEAPPEHRKAILEELGTPELAQAIGLGTGAAALVAANLSGFALYTAASSTLAAVTGAVGVTLPFATYMGLSSVLATLTGPIGWSALAAWAVVSMGGANYKKTIPAVILVGTVRTRLIAERDQDREALAVEQGLLEPECARLQRLRDFLDALGPGRERKSVRISDLPA